MREQKTKKRGLAASFALCPGRHLLALCSALLIALHLATRRSYALNRSLSNHLVRPIHKAFSRLTDRLPFSLAELLIALAVIGFVVYIITTIIRTLRRKNWAQGLYRLFLTLLSAGLAVYSGFCLLWGVYYYGDDFMAKSGLSREKISVAELAEVTGYFADLANEYAGRVPRDENGVCASDREAVLALSPRVYADLEREFPCLAGPAVHAKGVRCSRVMSLIDFTGFFFPFTAEANVNTDFPPSLFASTVAHELAHQRGVAKEQEANFVAVLACLRCGDPDYVYSAALLAYIHLGNALYEADQVAWKEISQRLSDDVLRDFAANRAYWQQFETPVQQVSNTVYEGFLQSYDQELGLKSYGACVDLLVNYYAEAARPAGK